MSCFFRNRLTVIAGSLLVVGSFSWAPFALWLGWKRCKTRRSKIIYCLVIAVVLFYPARRWQAVVRFPLWGRFVEYFSTEVRAGHYSGREAWLDNDTASLSQVVGDQPIPSAEAGPVIYAVEPHGTFPFGLGVVR
jgi:hypothetical protein